MFSLSFYLRCKVTTFCAIMQLLGLKTYPNVHILTFFVHKSGIKGCENSPFRARIII